MERKDAIEILRGLKPTNTVSITDAYNTGKALTMAIASLETDEAYQLEYEVSTQPSIEDFIEYAERTFGVKVSVKKSDNPDTVEKLFGECKTENLCDSCTNIGCMFQSGIKRGSCAFYMPPHLEPDNCGNYVVQDSTTKNDLGVDCISRDSAIKALDYDIKYFEFKSGVSKHMDDIAKLLNTIYETQVNNIKALPSVTPQEPRWIPVSERLPQKSEETDG